MALITSDCSTRPGTVRSIDLPASRSGQFPAGCTMAAGEAQQPYVIKNAGNDEETGRPYDLAYYMGVIDFLQVRCLWRLKLH